MMKCKIDGDNVILRKEDIEAEIIRYEELLHKHRSQLRRLLYYGKIDILSDMLKAFNEE